MIHGDLELAWVGDAVLNLFIKKHLLENKVMKLKKYQQEAISYLSAEGQRKIMEALIREDVLSEEELTIFKRGRNKSPKRTGKDIITYRISTGFETLIGFLYMNGFKERLNFLLNWSVKNEDLWKK